MVIRLVFWIVSILVLPIDAVLTAGRWIARTYYERRRPPWMDIGPCHPLSDDAGEHNVTFASRHDVAECGLKCQKCHKIAADRGDFKPVRRTSLGEAVVCPGCGDVLVASPDTEHGDDLLPYDKKVFHRFVRISELDALRQKYGPDIAGTDRSPTANADRYEGLTPRVKMRQQTQCSPEEQALREGLPWAEVAANPYEPEGPQAVHIIESHPQE